MNPRRKARTGGASTLSPDRSDSAVDQTDEVDETGEEDEVPGRPSGHRRSADQEPSEADRPESPAAVSALEVVLLALATAIGLLSLVSLAAAHLHHNSPGVVFPIALVLILGFFAVVWIFDRPQISFDPRLVVVGVLGMAVGAVMLFPGFQYATSDRDPGGYVEIAAAIQRHHSLEFTDPMTSPSLPAVARMPSVQQGWPGLWWKPGSSDVIYPQFYHLWPALLASAKDVGGWTGLFDVGPLVGVIAIGLVICIARRLGGFIAAIVAGAGLATNMLQVWQAKYPSAEIFGQMLFVAGVLAVILAVRHGWRSAAFVGGLMVGLAYLERADGLLTVLVAFGFVSVLIAARRWDSRVTAFFLGLLVLLPYGFYQAYTLAGRYTLVNNIPTRNKVLFAIVGMLLIGLLLAWQRRAVAWAMSWGSSGRRQQVIGVVFVAVCAVLMVVGFLRPKIFGDDYAFSGTMRYRTYDEISLVRLSWFISLAGFALLGAGIVWVAMRRWRMDSWVVGLTTVGFLTVFCWHVRNSPYLMWAFRRFVTTVLPLMFVLIGCGVAWCAWVLRKKLPEPAVRVGVAVVVLALSGFYLTESVPLRSHDENGGSVELVHEISDLSAGHQGVYIWDPGGACCARPSLLFGGSLFTIGGQNSALGPTDPDQLAALLQYYAKRPDVGEHPVFYIRNGSPNGFTLPGLHLSVAKEFAGRLPHWEETYISRPKRDVGYYYDITVYRVTPAS